MFFRIVVCLFVFFLFGCVFFFSVVCCMMRCVVFVMFCVCVVSWCVHVSVSLPCLVSFKIVLLCFV